MCRVFFINRNERVKKKKSIVVFFFFFLCVLIIIKSFAYNPTHPTLIGTILRVCLMIAGCYVRFLLGINPTLV